MNIPLFPTKIFKWSIYVLILNHKRSKTGPDSSSGRASALGAGSRGFDTRPRHSKGVKMVSVATLLGAQHYEASTGPSLTHY